MGAEDCVGYAKSSLTELSEMHCPECGTGMTDVTESWHTFAESQGAEYLADYVTIWLCPACNTVVGATDTVVEWVMETEGALNED